MFKKSLTLKATAIVLVLSMLLEYPAYAAPREQNTRLAEAPPVSSTLSEVQTAASKLTYNDATGTQSVSSTVMGKALQQFTSDYGRVCESFKSGNFTAFQTYLSKLKIDAAGLKTAFSKEAVLDNKVLSSTNATQFFAREKNFAVSVNKEITSISKAIAAIEKIELQDQSGYAEIVKQLNAINDTLCQQKSKAKCSDKLSATNTTAIKKTPNSKTHIAAAYMKSVSTLSESSLPRKAQDADLAQTEETAPTQEIKDLANSLSSPVKIYEYVRNNIGNEFYYGSKKGAYGTLLQHMGDDYDQASLLISMLRYKGIPARYVKATIELTPRQAMSWTGATTVAAASALLAKAGIPTTSMMSGSDITAIRIEHIYTEAYVGYDAHMGSVSVNGHKIWIPLDPGFKSYSAKSGKDFSQLTGISLTDLTNSLGTAKMVTSDGNGTARIDSSNLQNIYNKQVKALKTYLTNNSSTDLSDILGSRTIITQTLGVLPLSLPYKTVAVTAEYDTVPSAMKNSMTFSIQNTDANGGNYGDTSFTYTSNAAAIYNKNIVMSWEPATNDDKNVIAKYGSVFKTPAYLIKLKPVLTMDGTVVAEGESVTMGSHEQFDMTITAPEASSDVYVTNAITAGGMYCVTLDYGSISKDELTKASNTLKGLKSTANSSNTYTAGVMGELLSAVGKSYFGELDVYDALMSQKMGICNVRLLSEGITEYNANVSTIAGQPVSLSEGGVCVDVDSNRHSISSLNGTVNIEKAYMSADGVISSYLENAVLEQLLNTPSVSTIKILEQANTSGIPVYTINSDNISTVLPQLNINSSLKSEIKSDVSAGKQITIPQRNVQYFNWKGIGYIVSDPTTGSSAYMISGGISGGAESIVDTVAQITLDLVEGVLQSLLISLSEQLVLCLLPYGWVSSAIQIINMTLLIVSVVDIGMLIVEWGATGNISYLKQAAVQIGLFIGMGLLMKPLMTKLSGDIDILEKLVDSENTYYTDIEGKGLSDDTATDFNQKLGTTDAEGEINSLVNDGVGKDVIAKAGEDFDSDGLKAFRQAADAQQSDGSHYAEEDWGSLENIYRQCGNNDEFDTLTSDVSALNKAGVKPSEYSDYDISKPADAHTVKWLIDKGYKAVNLKSMCNDGCSPDKISNILKATKGTRPNPSTYFSKTYIHELLAQFHDGVSLVMTRRTYDKLVKDKPFIGYPDGTQFVTPKSIMDDIAVQANGDVHVFEEKLGFKTGHFEKGGGLVRIDVKINPDKLNLRIPSGNEGGANELWIPGGHTSGGIPEAVSDKIPNSSNYVAITFLN